MSITLHVRNIIDTILLNHVTKKTTYDLTIAAGNKGMIRSFSTVSIYLHSLLFLSKVKNWQQPL